MPSHRAILLPALLLAAQLAGALAAQPAAAQGSCGSVQHAATHHRSKRYRPPLAIGDSTMLLAMPNLAREGYDVNAHGCRQYSEALSLLNSLRRAGSIPHLVVIALGADGSVTQSDVQRTLQILGRRRILVLVTPRELSGGTSSDAQVVRSEGQRQPDRIRVLDWVKYSEGHANWFQPDHLHLTFTGAGGFARLLKRALKLAPPQPLVAPPAPAPRCPAPPPAASPPTPAPPSIELSVPGGILHVARSARSLSVPVRNTSPLAITGSARMTTFDPAQPSRPGDLLATACLSDAAGAGAVLTFNLSSLALRELKQQQRFPVQISLGLADSAGQQTSELHDYLLERPRRR